MRSDSVGYQEPKRPISVIRISIADMVSLRVRATETGNPPARFLYQQLPQEAITLLASIPSATSAVSIPQLNGRYPISANFPSRQHNGYVVVYERKPNGRYEAGKVFHEDKLYDVVPFHEIARREMNKSLGSLVPIPGKHVYFAPTRTQWEVILRDGGFTVVDPLSAAFGISPEILQHRQSALTSGVLARAPVCAPTRSSGTARLALFNQVELTLDPNPDLEHHWISFREFQRNRAVRSRLPEPIVPLFREWLQRFAAASGFMSWSFRKGVFFGDHQEWWGTKNRRRTMHEGIDFIEGSLQDGTIQAIREGTPVGALADGNVVTILNDFLSQTVVVCHTSLRDFEGNRFFTLYSHIHPEIDTSNPVTGGQILGRVAKVKEAGAPAHLHLTGAWIPESISVSQITLDMINPAFAPIVLINFNSLLLDLR
jgi:murein DD-endopeptidase MepM/ murein hydrolase activator NlpD